MFISYDFHHVFGYIISEFPIDYLVASASPEIKFKSTFFNILVDSADLDFLR